MTELLVCLIFTMSVGNNSCLSFISSFTCLHDFSSRFSFISVLQINKGLLS